MNQKRWNRVAIGLLMSSALAFLFSVPVQADPHPDQSVNVVIIGGATLNTSDPCGYGGANSMGATGGGCLPVTGPVGELGDFSFTPMEPSLMDASSLAPYDTAVLNVASLGIHCDTNVLDPQQKLDLIDFVGSGKKLIIYDSECAPNPVDYSWLPFPFTTQNPGAQGARGTLTIVEDNTLSTLIGDPTCTSGDIHCIDVIDLGNNTDAVGDMNVMTTYDPNWFIDMSGTNIDGYSGPVHTYANYPIGTDDGLIIYNGLDVDRLAQNNANLRKIWVQELQQEFNPSELPSSKPVIGILLTPATAESEVGQDHTVIATLTDVNGEPQEGLSVEFSVVSGPNSGTSGICSPNTDCTSDAFGEVGFTYTGSGGEGTDEISGCFTIDQDVTCAQNVFKVWTAPACTEMVIGDIETTSDPVAINELVEAQASFTNACDPHTGTWDWGDGNQSAATIEEDTDGGVALGSHTYTTAGVYTVTLTVTDSLGNASQSVYHYVVIYNSCGGFVTGSGWIHSPAGAYVEKPYLSGIATFGFTSDYLPGAKVPTGITTFHFLLGGLYFKSTSYDWLVVAGPHAKYKGEGKINFHGNYGFMLTATDGQARGGGGVDTFRIKIWDKDNNDAVVYDNQMGESDDSNAGTALTLGSIIVFR